MHGFFGDVPVQEKPKEHTKTEEYVEVEEPRLSTRVKKHQLFCKITTIKSSELQLLGVLKKIKWYDIPFPQSYLTKVFMKNN